MEFYHYILIGVLAVILIYFSFCLFIFLKVFARKKDFDWDNKNALKKTIYKDLIDGIETSKQWLKEQKVIDFDFSSFDGTKINATFIPVENARGTIILAHGYRGWCVSDFGIVLDLYLQANLNVLMFRQRAHGKSQGKFITFGAFEHKDLLSLINYHNENFGKFPIIMSGISMGASTVLYAISNDLPSNVKGATADCGFTSCYQVVKKEIENIIHIKAEFLMWGVNLWCKAIAKFNAKEYDTEKLLKNAKVPVIFLHGEADELVPCEMSVKSYNACASKKQLLLVKGAGHGMSYLCDAQRVANTLNEFFEEVLPK